MPCPPSSSAISTSGEEHAIAFDEAAYSLDTMGGYEFDTTNLRFSYSSMTTPSEFYDYDMAKRRPDCYASARKSRRGMTLPTTSPPASWRPSHDGAQVPVSILHAAISRATASAPLLLYGYGSYGMAMPASFSSQPAVAGRSRLRLCHRAYQGRLRQGLGLVPRRQAREEDQHAF